MKKAFALALAAASLCLACTRQNSKQEVKVMSFNLRLDTPADGDNRWDNRKAACIDLITDRRPDVLGIQEGLPHQVQFLADNLPGYAWVGTGRDSLSQGNEYSALFLRPRTLLSRWPRARSGSAKRRTACRGAGMPPSTAS